MNRTGLSRCFRAGARASQALVVALLALAFATSLLGSMSVALMIEGKVALAQSRRVEAHFLARAGLEAAADRLLRDDAAVDALADPWSLDARAFDKVPLGNGTWTVRAESEVTGRLTPGVVDEERKINVNRCDRDTLLKLHSALTREVVDALLAARAQRPFLSVEDLAALPWLDADALKRRSKRAPAGLRSLLTVWGDGRVNVNTAPGAVLACLPGLSAEDAQMLVQYRSGPDGKAGTADDRVFQSVDQVRKWLRLRPRDLDALARKLTVSSRHFTINAIGRLSVGTGSVRELRQVVLREESGLKVLRFEPIR